MSLSTLFGKIKAYAVAALAVISTVLFFLYRNEQSERAEAEAKGVAAESKGKLYEAEKQTKQAEEKASDSRADYERISAEYREGGD